MAADALVPDRVLNITGVNVPNTVIGRADEAIE